MKRRALAPPLFCLVATACQTGPPPSAPSPGGSEILIASDLPTSIASDSALSLQQAIQLAIDQHPTIGRYKLVYMPLDDSLASTASPEKGVQNVKRMIADARVLGMIGPYTSSAAREEIPVANGAGLVMLSPSNTNSCLTLAAPFCPLQPAALRPSGPNNYFRTAPPDPVQGRAMARFAFDRLNVRRAAAFGEVPDDDPYIDSFAAELARMGGELVLRKDLAQGTTDFTGFLRAARDVGAQAIYAATIGDHACAARAQMKRIFSDDAYFLGYDAIFGPDCIKEAVDNAEGMFATIPDAHVDVDPTHSTDAAVKKFVEAYRKKFPNTSEIAPYTYTLAAYDCALILIDAIKHAIDKSGGNLPTRPQVVDAVARAQFTGVIGSYSFNANGDAVSPPMSLYQAQNGQWVFLRQIDASSKQS